VPRRGRERRAILSPDLREDPTFTEDSEWSYRPAYEPCPGHRSGLLGDEEYDDATKVYLPEDEEAKEVAIPVEEYQPPDLSEEEAIRRAMEESELGLWDGLGAQLQASVTGDQAAPPPPPPPTPEPQAGWGLVVWELPQVNWGLGPRRALDASPATATSSGVGSPGDADGVLAISLGPVAAHQPHQGR
jgi:hypothetical protein